MGLIATSGQPEALDLFRKVMLASASIPIVFPPVFFEVVADGRRYDEMHVDGGVGARVFLNGGVFRPSLIRERGGTRRGTGGHLRDPQRPASRASEPDAEIAARHRVARPGGFGPFGADRRSVSHLCHSRREQAGYQWVTIPDGVEIGGAEFFDPESMKALYEVGYQSALAGPVWYTRPPGLQEQASP